MKRFVSILMTVILAAALFCPAFADSPGEPIIEALTSDYSMPIGSEVKVWVSASAPDKGVLRYQWYKTSQNDITTIRAIDGANSTAYDITGTKAGVEYYCCSIINTYEGKESAPVYTRLIKVEFYNPITLKPVINSQMPDCYIQLGHDVTLWTDATSTSGGGLHYQWYSTDENDITTIRAIDGANGPEYNVKKDKLGVTYYCCGISQMNGSTESAMEYTRLIRVEFYSSYPLDPVINSEMPDCYIPLGKDVTLWTDAVSPDGGTLSYQWYVSTTNSLANIKIIPDATSKDLYVKETTPDVKYYTCLIWNWKYSQTGGPLFTRLVRVQFYSTEPEQPEEEKVESISITQLPSKLTYEYGEKLDPEGLKVRVMTNLGFFDITDLNELKITPIDTEKPGEQTIFVFYEDKSDSFIVTVKEKPADPVQPDNGNTENTVDPGQNTNTDPGTQPSSAKSMAPYLYGVAGLVVGIVAAVLIGKKKK